MTLAGQVLAAARDAGAMIATAESCTAGMIAAAITDPAGASAVFDCGFVTYSNGSKSDILGVSQKLLADHGAVSEDVAIEMARGAIRRSRATHAVAVTGIAGPGGSDVKPEGHVCFALAAPTGVLATTVDFGAIGRAGVRQATTEHALRLLLAELQKGGTRMPGAPSSGIT